VLDRFAEAILFLGLLVFFNRAGSSESLYLYLTFAAMIGSFMVSYTRARAEGLGLTCKSGWFTRVERILLLSAGLLTGWVRPMLWLLAVLANVTAVQRMVHVYLSTRVDTPNPSARAGRA
jgi:CDP-diacylglycerol--glycerol-3-phosphate 3-phosphatidyltransferase